ncbi:MAG TPA: OmpA family protein [Caulobacteraceae bacterium]|jgi:outer membrane protein OmpA-like peptidoglycan-associated protein
MIDKPRDVRIAVSAAVIALFLAAAPAAFGEEIQGTITARDGANMLVTDSAGATTTITLSDATRVIAKGGTFGLARDELPVTDLINGLPVTVQADRSEHGVVATEVVFKGRDLRTARQVQAGTAQVRSHAEVKVSELEAKNAELRQRMAEANEYVVKGHTAVFFPTGSAKISEQGKSDLRAISSQAQTVKGYLIGVVGHADPTGDPERNQALSERRAAAVITYLQKYCNVHPYRVLSPDAMGDAHLVGDVSSPTGLAQNRRVEIKILANKGLEGL